jgi:hypothetical protein
MAEHKLTDMKRTKADKKAEEEGNLKGHAIDGEDYPYGLSIRLDHHSLKKLGMHNSLPKVGSKIMLHAHAHVKSASEHSEEGGKKRRHVELELRHMAVEGHEPGKGKGAETNGDTEEMNKGMKKAMDKAVVGPKEEGSEDEDGEEA